MDVRQGSMASRSGRGDHPALYRGPHGTAFLTRWPIAESCPPNQRIILSLTIKFRSINPCAAARSEWIKSSVGQTVRLGTLREPAHVADAATPFMFDRAAAIRTGAAVVGMRQIDVLVIGHVHLDRLGHSIGARGDAVIAEAGRFVTGDADHLFDGLAGLDPGAPGQ